MVFLMEPSARAVDISTHCFANCAFPDTGQSVCYDGTGSVIGCPAADNALAQDGTYTPGAAQRRYTIYNPVGISSVTVDNLTGLMWITNPMTDAAMGGAYTWLNALNACEGKSYAGYSDWRLPNARELISIVDFGASAAPYINLTAFPNSKSSWYWTSTTYLLVLNVIWRVNFSIGSVGGTAPDDTSPYVRCVRGGA